MNRPDRPQVQGHEDVVSVLVGGVVGAVVAFAGALLVRSVLSPVLAFGQALLPQPGSGAGVVPVLALVGFLVGALVASRRWD